MDFRTKLGGVVKMRFYFAMFILIILSFIEQNCSERPNLGPISLKKSIFQPKEERIFTTPPSLGWTSN